MRLFLGVVEGVDLSVDVGQGNSMESQDRTWSMLKMPPVVVAKPECVQVGWLLGSLRSPDAGQKSNLTFSFGPGCNLTQS